MGCGGWLVAVTDSEIGLGGINCIFAHCLNFLGIFFCCKPHALDCSCYAQCIIDTICLVNISNTDYI